MICASIDNAFFKFNTLAELEEASINYYDKITKLSIVHAKMDKIPNFIRYFQNLEYLYIEDETLIDCSLIEHLTNLKILNIRNTKIQELLFLKKLTLLHELVLFRNSLKVFPQGLGLINTLLNLYIEEDINSIPEEFSSHLNLKSFFFKSNNLFRLHDKFGDFPSLIELMIFGKLEILPKTIYKMKKLEFLDLYNNSILKIHPEISFLKNLKFLSLRRNKLKNFPKEIFEMRKLKIIDIRDNHLANYNQIIQTNKKLYLSGNEFNKTQSKGEETEFYGYDQIDMHIVDENVLYRGRQPSIHAYKFIQKSKGIRTIICLRELGNKFHELPEIKSSKLNFITIPIDTNFPKISHLIQSIDIIKQKEYWPIYIHCFTGKDRTGLACAFYRCVINNWSVEDAIAEMKEMGIHYWRNNLVEFLLREIYLYKNRRY